MRSLKLCLVYDIIPIERGNGNENEKELGSYECSNKDTNLCYVDTNLNQDSFDVIKLVDFARYNLADSIEEINIKKEQERLHSRTKFI